MLRFAFGCMLLVLGSASVLSAEPSAASLRGYLAKSQACVSGTWTQVIGESGEAGVIHYHCELEVRQVIAGQCSEKKIRVGFVRLESKPEDLLPFLKEGGKCILFLKRTEGKDDGVFTLADPSWGMQAFSEDLARAIGNAQESRGTESTEKASAVSEPVPSVELAGAWLLTMPAGYEYEAKIERVEDGEKSERYRLTVEATNLRGIYEWKNGRLTLIKPDSERMEGLAWEIKNKNVALLVDHPESAHVGADYRNATLSRSKVPDSPPR